MLSNKTRNEWIDICFKNWTPSAAKLYRIANTGIEQSASDCLVMDHRGRSFIDCACSYGIFLVGHSNPTVKAHSLSQLNQLSTVPFGFKSRPQLELSEKLKVIVPGEWGLVNYTMTGAEAIEQIIRFVLPIQAPKKRIIVMQKSYHGKTLATMNILGQSYDRNEHGLNRENIVFIPYGDFDALEDAINDQVAAVFVEPILGGAYLQIPPKGYIKYIRDLCDAFGCLLVADEIQTAFGRCGKWFAIEYDDIVPDIIVLSKGLTGGYAAVAAIMYSKALSAQAASVNFSRNGGQPYACATALGAIEILERDQLIEKSQQTADNLGHGLRRLAEEYPQIIIDAPAIGLMTGLRLRGAVFEALLSMELTKRGIHAGHSMNEKASEPVLRFYPPLTISDNDISSVLSAISDSLSVIAKKPKWQLRVMSAMIHNLYKVPYSWLRKGANND